MGRQPRRSGRCIKMQPLLGSITVKCKWFYNSFGSRPFMPRFLSHSSFSNTAKPGYTALPTPARALFAKRSLRLSSSLMGRVASSGGFYPALKKPRILSSCPIGVITGPTGPGQDHS